MAKKRTEVSRYPSRYSPGGWVTEAQYIIELVCERRARSLNKDLPVRFWNQKEWQAFYKAQLRITHKLLKKYEAKSIIDVLKEGRIWSLRPAFVEEKIQIKQKAIDNARLAAQIRDKEKDKEKIDIDKSKLKDKRESFGMTAKQKLLEDLHEY